MIIYLLGIAFVLDLIAIGCLLYAKKLLKVDRRG